MAGGKDFTTETGNAGETQQIAAGDTPAMTTNFGVPISDNENSLKAGSREPTLLEDFVLREKIFHFDHERVPERIVQARGSAAHGYFECHDAIADRGAHAVIPPRKNAKPWKTITAGAVARNEALRATKYLGRALWRRWSGYHRRSRVETKMHRIKLLGQRLMARDFDRQVAELQVRIAVLNGYTALGIPVTEAVG